MNINPAEIRSLQKEKGLTGYKLAELANLRPQSLSTIKKRGTTTPTVARAIARALGVSLEEITEKEQISTRSKMSGFKKRETER